jgi:6-phosphogluconate dehydrogenase
MVHNGIEYGDMQLIAETYDIMRRTLGLQAAEIADVFEKWNTGKLESYLIEITSKVLRYVDSDTGMPLVDLILDQAEQKGTGRWTSQNSFELATPIPVIDAAVIGRSLSAMKEKRVAASKILTGPGSGGQSLPDAPDRDSLIDALEDALYFAKISSYAQGMSLLAAAAEAYDRNLNLAEIARIWKAGCIIRARLLDPISHAFEANPELDNLMLDPYFAEGINSGNKSARTVLKTALDFGVPTPALSWALNYVNTYRQEHLPANLIQGQRDFFGAHTYKRVDRDGTFHTEWTESAEKHEEPEAESKPSDRKEWSGGEDEGERSPKPADAPKQTDEHTTTEPGSRDLQPDPDDKGERTPQSTKKAEF